MADDFLLKIETFRSVILNNVIFKNEFFNEINYIQQVLNADNIDEITNIVNGYYTKFNTVLENFINENKLEMNKLLNNIKSLTITSKGEIKPWLFDEHKYYTQTKHNKTTLFDAVDLKKYINDYLKVGL
jgi:hypothetical protein